MTNTYQPSYSNHINVVAKKSTEQSKSNESRANLIIRERRDHHPVAGSLDEVFALQELYLANENLQLRSASYN